MIYRNPLLLFCLFSLFLSLSPPLLKAAPPEVEKEFGEAVRLFQEGKDQEAEARFLDLLKKDPTAIRPRNFLGLIYARTGRSEEAVATFLEIIRIDPKYPGGYFGLGLVMKQRGELDRARGALAKSLELAPKHPLSWFHLAQILEVQKKAEEAVAAYRKVLEVGPEDSEEVREAKKRIEEIGETPEIARKVRDLRNQAVEKAKGENPKAAIPLYAEAATLLPKGKEIRIILANVAAATGDPAKAEEALQEVIRIDPAHLPARLFLGRLYQQTGRKKEAIGSYEAILAINQDEKMAEVRSAKETLFSLLDQQERDEETRKADFLVREKRWEEALRAFQAAVSVDPEATSARYNLAQFYLQINRPDLAREEVIEALTTEPDSRSLRILLGKIDQQEHYYIRSMEAYLKSLSIGVKEGGFFSLEAQAGLIQSGLLRSNALLEAIRPFAEALTKKGRGNIEGAESSLKGIVLLLPEHPLPYFHLGEIYEKKGEIDQAIDSFEKTVRFQPGFYPAWLSLAKLYEKEKKNVSALSAYERLLRLSDPELEKLGTSRETVQKERDASFQKLKEAREITRALFSQAQAALAEERGEEAIAPLLSANAEEPDNPAILNSLGIAYASVKKWEEAVTTFKKVLKIDPAHRGARLRLATAEEARGSLLAARQGYQSLLLEQKEDSENKLAQAGLLRVKETLKRYREAERHEKRGRVVFESMMGSTGEKPDPESLRIALWDLRRATELRPEIGRYHYAYALFYQEINKGTTDPQIIQEAIRGYQTAIEKDPAFPSPYLSLGRIYEFRREHEKAVDLYQSLLSQNPNSGTGEVKEAQERLAALNKRLFGNIGYLVGVDSNFPLSTPPQDDSFNNLSANLTYYLLRSSRLQIPLSYTHQTSIYYRVQTYFSNNGLSLGVQHRLLPSFSYGLTGRFQAAFAKGEGLSSLLSQGTATLTYFGDFFSTVSLEYTYSDLFFPDRRSFNAGEQRGTLSFIRRISERDEGTFSYGFVDRRTTEPLSAGFTDNSYQGHQLNLGYRRRLHPDLLFRGDGGALLQNFTLPDPTTNSERRNVLLSYGLGLTYSW
ncbi:MAG: tetratricopeptide repeat protein, partial [Candidatus Manganitrophaceae bacterium]